MFRQWKSSGSTGDDETRPANMSVVWIMKVKQVAGGGADSVWQSAPTGVSYLDGNVGIGTDNPGAKLEIAGTPGVDGIQFPDGTLQTTAGGGGGDSTPLGTIIAWHKSLTGTPSIPDGWVECNGQTLSDPASPLNGQVIPNLNGHPSGANSPGLGEKRSMFLRGGTSSGAGQDGTYQQHIDLASFQPFTGGGGSAFKSGLFLPRSSINGDETRPVNMTVVWIMKVKQVAPEARSAWTLSGSNLHYTDGRVGIGTQNPSQILHVQGNEEAMGWFQTSRNNMYIHMTTSDGSQLLANRPGNRFAVWNPTSGDVFNILPNGNVGMGISAPTHRLDVEGDIRLGSTMRSYGRQHLDGGELCFLLHRSGVIISRAWGGTGNLTVEGGFFHTSDVRSKKKIQPLTSSLAKVRALRGVSFEWKDDHAAPGRQPGFVAQEVREVLPEVVQNDNEGKMNVSYTGLIPWVVEAIKEQQTILDRIHSGIATGSLARTTPGMDYAELFESTSGERIPVGTSVVLDDGRIRAASDGETPLGVISANPGMLGGVFNEWPGKYERDEFGAPIMETHEEEIMEQKTELVRGRRARKETKTVTEEIPRMEVVLEDGKYIQREVTQRITREIETPVYEEHDLYDADGRTIIGKHRVEIMEDYEDEVPVYDDEGRPVMVGTGRFETRERQKIHPDYDPDRPYVPRSRRPEWNPVGLLGQLALRKGQPVADTWIKLKDISGEVELWLVK